MSGSPAIGRAAQQPEPPVQPETPVQPQLPVPGTEAPPPPVQLNGTATPLPEVEAAIPRYLQWRQARFVDWLTDGSLLISTRFGDTEQIHRVHMPLGMREQVSFAPAGVTASLAQPYANDTLIYLELLHGGQNSRWFMQHMDTHELVALTDGQHRDGPAVWAHDGHRLAFASQRVNGTDSEIYEVDATLPAATPRLLAGGAGYRWRILDRSADDRRLLLGRTPSAGAPDVLEGDARPADLYELEIASGDLAPLTGVAGSSAGSNHSPAAKRGAKAKKRADGAALQVRAARYSPDGHGIVLLTDQPAPGSGSNDGDRFTHLVYFDPRDQQWRTLAAPANRDVARFDLSADGRYVAYSIRADNGDQLMVLDQVRKLDQPVTALPQGTIGLFKFDASGQRLALSVESVRSPGDVYVYETATRQLTPWTHSEAGPIDTQSFVLPERLSFPTWDRQEGGRPRQLLSMLYRTPAQAPVGTAGPHPVVIWLSSGVGAPSRPRFDPFVQYLVSELSAVVVAPRVRSASPGADDPSEDAVRDVGSLLVWIGLQRELDRSRVVLMGEGFGAYIALQSLADYGDRLRGAVAAFAPHGSALAHSGAIRRPLLLVQGMECPGAPAYELEQLRQRLRAEGVDAQTLEAPGEGFGFAHKRNRDAYQATAANFVTQLLR